MLNQSICNDATCAPRMGFSLYTITKRQDQEPRHDDPKASVVTRQGDVFDLRSPHGDVIATDHDLRQLRAVQTKYNAVALLG